LATLSKLPRSSASKNDKGGVTPPFLFVIVSDGGRVRQTAQKRIMPIVNFTELACRSYFAIDFFCEVRYTSVKGNWNRFQFLKIQASA
jgi:hypothetical protein